MEFSQFCFTLGKGDFLYVSVQSKSILQVLRIEKWAPLRLEKLFNVKDINCSRLAWLDGCLLAGVYEIALDSFRMEAFLLTTQGLEKIESNLLPEEETFAINAMNTGDGCLYIYNNHLNELIEFG